MPQNHNKKPTKRARGEKERERVGLAWLQYLIGEGLCVCVCVCVRVCVRARIGVCVARIEVWLYLR